MKSYQTSEKLTMVQRVCKHFNQRHFYGEYLTWFLIVPSDFNSKIISVIKFQDQLHMKKIAKHLFGK
jgi:hypothetical protein